MTKKYHNMSEDSSFKELRTEAENMRVIPPKETWSKIQNKMNKETDSVSSWKLSGRFILSMAASVFLAVLCYNVIMYNIEHQSDSLKGNIVAWENLDYSTDYLYSVEQVRDLRHFYAPEEVSIN